MVRKNVVVIGASGGIGSAVSKKFCLKGYRVICLVRNIESVNFLRDQNCEFLAVDVDLANNKSIDLCLNEISRLCGDAGISCIVNCAGVAAICPVEYYEDDVVEYLWKVNFFGVFRLIKGLLWLVRKDSGAIVNIGSMSCRLGLPFGSMYSATKSALLSFTQSLRYETMSMGVRATYVELGKVKTGIKNKSMIFSCESSGDRIAGIYATRIQAILSKFDKRAGVESSCVARLVAEISEKPHVKERYILGADARMRMLMCAVFPSSVIDIIVSKIFG